MEVAKGLLLVVWLLEPETVRKAKPGSSKWFPVDITYFQLDCRFDWQVWIHSSSMNMLSILWFITVERFDCIIGCSWLNCMILTGIQRYEFCDFNDCHNIRIGRTDDKWDGNWIPVLKLKSKHTILAVRVLGGRLRVWLERWKTKEKRRILSNTFVQG